MPRRAVPARFMSNAASKNFAEASGSSTMIAMCRSLDAMDEVPLVSSFERMMLRMAVRCNAILAASPVPFLQQAARGRAMASVIDGVDVMVGIDHRFDHRRSVGRQ